MTFVFVALIGDRGVGKSTAARHLCDTMDFRRYEGDLSAAQRLVWEDWNGEVLEEARDAGFLVIVLNIVLLADGFAPKRLGMPTVPYSDHTIINYLGVPDLMRDKLALYVAESMDRGRPLYLDGNPLKDRTLASQAQQQQQSATAEESCRS